MKKKATFIPIVTDRDINQVEHWFEMQDGTKLFLPYNFGIRINFKDMTYTNDFVSELYDLNELIDNGTIVLKFAYKIVDLDFDTYPNRIPLKKALSFFKSKGFNVTEEAIRHNFYSWRSSLKSGYRDEKNGYHLFTPCGGNPLSFRLTTLHKPCDWQITYEC